MNEEQFKVQLDILKADIDFYNDWLKEISKDIIKDNFSKYPIFIAHQHESKIGEMVLDMRDFARDHSINASTLEELIKANAILENKKEDFITTYKNPAKFICVFWLRPDGANFIFMPYKKA